MDPSRPIEAPVPAHGWRHSHGLAFLEFAMVALIFIADLRHLIPFSKTPFLLLLGWISLRIRGVSWRSIGFTLNRNWVRTLGLGIGGGLLLELFQLFVTQPLLARLTGKQPDLSDFAILRGNLKYTLIGIALAWTLAAIGEELVWRGYLMNRVAGVGKFTSFAWIVSLVLVSAAFGAAHSDQGVTGQIEEAIAGAFLAAMYLATRKNLAVPILAHGASDTLDMILFFLGKYPGT
jgi:membrane protease YdiL (CAAX protease family)